MSAVGHDAGYYRDWVWHAGSAPLIPCGMDLRSDGVLRVAAFSVVVPGQLSSQVWNTLDELAWVNCIVIEVWHMHLALPTFVRLMSQATQQTQWS